MGWMVGANPKYRVCDRADLCRLTWAARHVPPRTAHLHGSSHRLRWIALLSALIPLSFILVQCGQAPSAGTLAANMQGTSDSFDDRFPQPQFKDRFPSPGESLLQRQASDTPSRRTAQAQPAPYRVAS